MSARIPRQTGSNTAQSLFMYVSRCPSLRLLFSALVNPYYLVSICLLLLSTRIPRQNSPNTAQSLCMYVFCCPILHLLVSALFKLYFLLSACLLPHISLNTASRQPEYRPLFVYVCLLLSYLASSIVSGHVKPLSSCLLHHVSLNTASRQPK